MTLIAYIFWNLKKSYENIAPYHLVCHCLPFFLALFQKIDNIIPC